MALPGDREWESQLAVDTYEKQSLLEGDVNDAAGGSRVVELAVDTYEKQSSLKGDVNGAAEIEKSVGHGHKYEKQHIYTEIEKESVSNSGIQ